MESAAVITLVIFVAGCIYQAGRLSSRVDGLERDVDEVKNGQVRILERLGLVKP